jgi:hypothetical protein
MLRLRLTLLHSRQPNIEEEAQFAFGFVKRRSGWVAETKRPRATLGDVGADPRRRRPSVDFDSRLGG